MIFFFFFSIENLKTTLPIYVRRIGVISKFQVTFLKCFGCLSLFWNWKLDDFVGCVGVKEFSNKKFTTKSDLWHPRHCTTTTHKKTLRFDNHIVLRVNATTTGKFHQQITTSSIVSKLFFKEIPKTPLHIKCNSISKNHQHQQQKQHNYKQIQQEMK